MEYTAIYSTEKVKDIKYSFTSEDDDKAVAFCNYKFDKGLSIKLVEDTGKQNAGDGRIVKEFIN